MIMSVIRTSLKKSHNYSTSRGPMEKIQYRRVDNGEWYTPYSSPFYNHNYMGGKSINHLCWFIEHPVHKVQSWTKFEIKDGHMVIYTPVINHSVEWWCSGLPGYKKFEVIAVWVPFEDLPPALLEDMHKLKVKEGVIPRHPLEDTFDQCKALGQCKWGKKCPSRRVCYVYSDLEANTEIVFED